MPLDASKLRSEAIDSGWRQLDVVDETGSTNADLLARAAAGADIEGAVLIAEHQTAGRGGWGAAGRPRRERRSPCRSGCGWTASPPPPGAGCRWPPGWPWWTR
ncbi:biotin--[acetyl-CoA-carboxylase] ligase domain protein [Mycobacterium ulcerans str. Harvey]|uniref:Biotin--[acetyl-CoA-carboxylase] ligase domain protein n=1 Tax=Mycobacterium ulcerans str. Harvey TaxID=1299332 RepID=A0ABP3AEP1_MYCUL|nr:biotin--[acetyl-CoA-carboxylase] ligase domain protein [Mycobacterium ulcerans str. Harvey]